MRQSIERKREYNRLRQRRLRGYLGRRETGGKSEGGVVPDVVPVDKRNVVPSLRQGQRELVGNARQAMTWWWEQIAMLPMGARLCFLLPTRQVVEIGTGELLGQAVSPLYQQEPTYQRIMERLEKLELDVALHEALESPAAGEGGIAWKRSTLG